MNKDIVSRSRRHHAAETASQVVHLPGQTIGHLAANSVHVAYCKEISGFGSTIPCYLDTDLTGQEITVNCMLYEGGIDLASCAPLLAVGDPLLVVKVEGDWYAVIPFINTDVC